MRRIPWYLDPDDLLSSLKEFATVIKQWLEESKRMNAAINKPKPKLYNWKEHEVEQIQADTTINKNLESKQKEGDTK